MIRLKSIFFLFCCLFIFSSCFDEIEEIKGVDGPYPYDLEFFPDSREVVMLQDKSWESFGLFYFNVVKRDDGLWQMWYNARGNENIGSWNYDLCYAYSTNGKDWIKLIPGKNQDDNVIVNGDISPGWPLGSGWLETYVFLDKRDEETPYRMIYSARKGYIAAKVYMAKSKNGIDWIDSKVVLESSHDSQFVVDILDDGNYYVFLRIWNPQTGDREIGHAVITSDGELVQAPTTILGGGLYTSASSSLAKDEYLMFPTVFNEIMDEMYIGVAFYHHGQSILSKYNISAALFQNDGIKWGLVSPGLISTGVLNEYWIYYYGATAGHLKAGDHSVSNTDTVFKYYRIKVKVKKR